MPVNSFENYPMNWKPVLNHVTGALYKTLAQILEEDIKKGTLLMPQRELADFRDFRRLYS